MASAILLLSAGFASAQGQGHKRVHRLARIIEKHASELHEEVDDHFKSSPAYKHLHRHSREIEKLARAIHETTDEGGNKRLRGAVYLLDKEIHHFVEVAEDARQFTQVPPQAYAHLRREVRYLHEAVRDMKRELD